MLNITKLVVTLALTLVTATGALAATKKPIGLSAASAASAAVANSYASVAMQSRAEEAWLDQAKGNIFGN